MNNTKLLLITATLAGMFAVTSTNVKAAASENNCVSCEERCDAAKQHSVQEIINKLKNEINKGHSVHTEEELLKFKSELDYYQALFVNMMNN